MEQKHPLLSISNLNIKHFIQVPSFNNLLLILIEKLEKSLVRKTDIHFNFFNLTDFHYCF